MLEIQKRSSDDQIAKWWEWSGNAQCMMVVLGQRQFIFISEEHRRQGNHEQICKGTKSKALEIQHTWAGGCFELIMQIPICVTVNTVACQHQSNIANWKIKHVYNCNLGPKFIITQL